jgi:two-component system response regulator GlrR
VESELFGHVKGAFTGADTTRAGAFETAEGGTVFLDEIGELPLALQPKLLRVLESGTVKPLGAPKEKQVSVRVVAATHRDLRKMVNGGTFREDLYFRLAVCPVRVPPLRERLEDLPILARHFLARALAGAREGGPAVEPSAETLAVLRAQPWSGNVRELRNAVERAVILGDPEEVGRGELARALRELGGHERRSEPAHVPLEEAKRRFEREYLVKLLARYEGDITAAAGEADLHPKSLERLIRRHELRR